MGGIHCSFTTNFDADITINKKTGKRLNFYLVVVQIVIKKTMTVSHNTKQAKSLCDVFKNLGKEGLNASKKMAKNVS